MLGESKQGRKESHEAYKKRKEEYHKIKEEYSKKEKRFKELANKILESSANTKLEKLNAKNSSKETFYRHQMIKQNTAYSKETSISKMPLLSFRHGMWYNARGIIYKRVASFGSGWKRAAGANSVEWWKYGSIDPM